MDDGVAVLGIALLEGGRLDHVAALLVDVELDEALVAGLLVLNGVELLLVQTIDVADVAQPGVHEAQVLGGHGGLDTAAAVVAADDNVLYLEVLDGVLDDAHNVEVRVAHQVGNVAVHKGVTGLQARDLLGGDARVGAADPEVLGVLAGRELLEELGVLGHLLGGPGLVVLKHLVVRLLEIHGDVLFAVFFGGGRDTGRVRAAEAARGSSGGSGCSSRKGREPQQGSRRRSREGEAR